MDMNTKKINNNAQPDFDSIKPSTTSKPKTQSNQAKPVNKMQKVDKIRLWAGICFMAFVLLFVLGLLVVPRIIEPCSIFSSYSNTPSCDSRWGGYNFWLLISFFLGIPLNIIGGSFILRSVSNWGKVKHPGFITFLVIVVNILLPILLMVCIK